jgi:pimeloyl-ACP methyl ester carboxylesterase
VNEERYRRAELALWRSVGAVPTERTLVLERTRTSVRIQEIGDGQPVVFVHGASNGGASWASLAARLEGFRCVLVDRPGCALSPRLDLSHSDMDALGTFADALVVDVLDAMDLPRAHLIGTSFGGYFVLRAAAAHPDRFDRLVTLSWSFGAPMEATPLVMRIAMQPFLRRLATNIPPTERMARAMLKQIGLRHAVESGRFGDVELAWFLSLLRDTDTMRNEIDAMPRIVNLRGFNDDTLLPGSVLARVTAPTYVLWGEDDPMGGVETARQFVRHLPNAELEVMAGAGHAPWMDDPDHVASRVDAFLRTMEPTVRSDGT